MSFLSLRRVLPVVALLAGALFGSSCNTYSAASITVALAPPTATIPAGQRLQFTATVAGTSGTTNVNVTWSVQEGASGGTITQGGAYTAPSTIGTFHVIAASQAAPTRTATATVVVTASQSVTISLSEMSVTLPEEGTQQFTASVGGASDTSVSWSVQEGAAGGTVSSTGLYAAPAGTGTFHVVATANADPTATATATIVVSAQSAVNVSLNEVTATVLEGGTQQFSATVTGAPDTSVSWAVLEGAPGGSVSSTGLYTAPNTTGTFHVVASANADTLVTATAAVTVSAPPTVVAISITPLTASLPAQGQQGFDARVTGSSNTSVTWSVEESQGGTVDAHGNYTAPNQAGTFHVLATSVADSTQTAEATVTVGAPAVVGVAVSPTAASIAAGAQQQIIAAVTNSTNTAVTWSVDESGAGSVSSGGLYTAPNLGGTFHVRATSVAQPTQSAAAAITVSAPLAVTVGVTPPTPSIPANASQQFSAAVSNASSTSVVWSIDEAPSGGAITSNGLYTAPGAAGSFHVRATSTVDTTVYGEAVVTVTAPSAITVIVAPATPTIAASGQQQFSAAVANASSTSVTWSIDEGASGGSVTLSGLYFAPASAGTFHVRATSVADNSKSGVAVVTVSPPGALTVAVTPGAPTLAADAQQQFSTTVTNSTNTAVTWSVDEAAGGSVSTTGLYAAPNAAGTFHVRATSEVDGVTFGEAIVTVLAPPPISVSVSPTAPTVAAGQQQQFSATVQNTATTGVTWTIDESDAGSVTALGLFTAPDTGGTFHVRATSVADTSKFAEATVTVTPPPPVAITVTPPTAYLQVNTGWQYISSVSNAADTSVTWSVVGTGNGTVTSGGYYTAPANPGAYTIRATSNADPTKSSTASAVVSVQPPNVVVSIVQTSPFVAANGTIALTAMVTGTSNNAVTWSLPQGSYAGSINGNGDYTASANPGTYTVEAISQANGTSYATVSVRVDSVTVTVTPTTPTVAEGTTQQFMATVTIGNSDPLPQTVTWSVEEGTDGGSVSDGGLYTPPATPGIAHVVATSTADPLAMAIATVNVTAPIAPAPTGVTATPGNQQVTLTWSSAVGAVSSNVYFAPHGGLGTAAQAKLTSAPIGVVIDGLSNGQAYDFVVTSVNTGGESGTSTPIATATPSDAVVPAAYALWPLPSSVAVPLTASPYIEFTLPMQVSTLNTSTFTLSAGGTAVQGALSFDGTRAIFTPTVPLTPLTSYTATVLTGATDVSGVAFHGASWSFTTQVESTDAVHVLFGDDALTLSWDPVPGALVYTIYRSAVSGGPYVPIYGTAGLSFTDNDVSNATDYYYVITATTAAGEGAPSDEVEGAPSALLPDAPSPVYAAAANNQAVLTWGSAGANLTYNILRGTASGGPYTLLTSTGNSLGYVDDTITNGTAYFYVIRAIDTQQNSSASSEEVTATPSSSVIAAPTGLSAASGNSYVGLSWSPVAAATGYVTLRTTTYGGPYTELYATNQATTNWVDTNVSNNVTYFYVVAAVDQNGNVGTYSTAVEGNPASYAATLASVLSYTNAYNGRVTLSWTSAPGASTYEVQRAIGSGSASTVTTTGAQSYTDTSLADGTTYTYSIVSLNSGYTATSNTVSVTPAAATVTAPGGVVAEAGDSSVTVTWIPVPGATSYSVTYGIQSGGPYTTGSASASTVPLAIFNSVANGSPFYFIVTASGPAVGSGTQTSGPSSEVTATPEAINVPGQTSSSGSYAGGGVDDLFWQPVIVPDNPATNPVTFNVYRTIGLVPWTMLNAGGPLSTFDLIDNDVVNGQTYYYSVAPVLNGTEGPWSQPFSLTPNGADPAPPTNITISPGDNYATLSWPAEPGVNGYTLYSSGISGGPYQGLTSASTYPSATIQVANATPTYVVIRSTMPGAPAGSSDSVEVVVNTSSAYPTAPSVSAISGAGEIALNWPSVAKATGFNIYRTTATHSWQMLASTPATRTGYVDSTPINGVQYYYAVASVGNSTGTPQEATWSNIVSAMAHSAQPSPPANLVAHPGNGAVTFTWSPVAGAAYYYLYTDGISGGPYAAYTDSTTNAFTFTGLGNGTPLYTVLETDDTVEGLQSGYSDEIAATPEATLLLPSGFTLLQAQFDGTYVEWTPVSGATGYHLYRTVVHSGQQAGTWMLVSTPSGTFYQDAEVTNGVGYQYAVTGVAAGVEGPWAFSSQVTPNANDPLAPGGLYLQPGQAEVTLTWNAVAGATYYGVYTSATSGGPYGFYTTTYTPELTVGATNGATGYYVVTTYDGSTISGFSPEISGVALASLVGTPNLQTPVTTTTQVTLNWGAVAGASSYLLYRFTPGGAHWALVGETTALTYADTTVQVGTGYQYCLAAANGSGVGAWSSATAVVTP